MTQATRTGIGRALRTARRRRGKSLEEASRDTRVRTDYLAALEHETFEALGEDVYVRSFLRSYAKYLGLNHEKVISVYERAVGRTEPAPAPVELAPTVAPTEAVELTEPRRPNWLLAGGAAIIVLAALAAIGVLNRGSVPEPAPIQAPPQVPVVERRVQVDVMAVASVDVTVVIDGVQQGIHLDTDEARSFLGEERIDLTLSEGDLAEVTVNGHRLRRPGVRHEPYVATFTPTSYGGLPDVVEATEDQKAPKSPTPSP